MARSSIGVAGRAAAEAGGRGRGVVVERTTLCSLVEKHGRKGPGLVVVGVSRNVRAESNSVFCFSRSQAKRGYQERETRVFWGWRMVKVGKRKGGSKRLMLTLSFILLVVGWVVGGGSMALVLVLVFVFMGYQSRSVY